MWCARISPATGSKHTQAQTHTHKLLLFLVPAGVLPNILNRTLACTPHTTGTASCWSTQVGEGGSRGEEGGVAHSGHTMVTHWSLGVQEFRGVRDELSALNPLTDPAACTSMYAPLPFPCPYPPQKGLKAPPHPPLFVFHRRTRRWRSPCATPPHPMTSWPGRMHRYCALCPLRAPLLLVLPAMLCLFSAATTNYQLPTTIARHCKQAWPPLPLYACPCCEYSPGQHLLLLCCTSAVVRNRGAAG